MSDLESALLLALVAVPALAGVAAAFVATLSLDIETERLRRLGFVAVVTVLCSLAILLFSNGATSVSVDLRWMARPEVDSLTSLPFSAMIRLTLDRIAVVWIAVAGLFTGAILSKRQDESWPPFTAVSIAALLAIMASLVGLTMAGNALTLLVFWEAGSVALWSFLKSRLSAEAEAEHRAAGRILLTGLLMDGLLVTAAAASAPILLLPADGEIPSWVVGPAKLFALGLSLAAAGRCGLMPASGWIKSLQAFDTWTVVIVWSLGILAPAAVLFARVAELLAVFPPAPVPPLDRPIAGLLMLTGMIMVLSAASQRRRQWLRDYLAAITGGTIGVTCIVTGPFWGSILGAMLIALWAIVVAKELLTPLPFDPNEPAQPRSKLQELAASDWGVPQLWWSFVDLPMRGLAQFTRFLDAFVFDLLLGRAVRMVTTMLSRFGAGEKADPVWLPAFSLMILAGLLMVLAWR